MTTLRWNNNIKSRNSGSSWNTTIIQSYTTISVSRPLLRNNYSINLLVVSCSNCAFCSRTISFNRNSCIFSTSRRSYSFTTIGDGNYFNRSIYSIISNRSIIYISIPIQRNWHKISRIKFNNISRFNRIKILPNIIIATTSSRSWF